MARDWIKDCAWAEGFDDGDIDAMTDAEIEKGIVRHYEGGVEEFIKNCEPRARRYQ